MNTEAVNRLIVGAGLKTILTVDQVQQTTDFLELRARWNRTHNLMGPKAARNPWQIDVCDAVALMEIYQPGCPLFDVGSGSGVPGLLFAILYPSAEVRLIEPLAKRAAFLKTAVHLLKVNNAEVERTRWPMDALPPCQVVSRAVVIPEAWPKLANADPNVRGIYRYLALNRPDFGDAQFVLSAHCNYRRSDEEHLRLEYWSRH